MAFGHGEISVSPYAKKRRYRGILRTNKIFFKNIKKSIDIKETPCLIIKP